ncbi:polymeric immunoglobulin receptor-like [Brienomyrus brachyistius]|uniref:polymeric immunoglobulin receptor-like n=1 Tax=Brienomyrus brachyistius TaxID=42636 RepID=UPI0020B349A9|nr:polymeric immunoglobulin receptor-like [Brienomyrus brachyistius]
MASCISQGDGLSVTDSPGQGVFTVTMRSLQRHDTGLYSCAVQAGGEIRAVGDSYSITVINGSPDLSVRDIMVNGEEGGTVTVQCLYSDKDKYTKKTWCRRNMEKSCLQTWHRTETFDRNRTKLHVNNVQRIMTVTLTRLEMKDTDWYWCGVGDLNFPVHITVSHQTQSKLNTEQSMTLK